MRTNELRRGCGVVVAMVALCWRSRSKGWDVWVGGLIDDLVSRYDELIGGQWYQGITAEWEEVVIVESLGVRNQAVVACSGNRVPIYSSTMIA